MRGEEVNLPFLCLGGFPCDQVLVLSSFSWGLRFSHPARLDFCDFVIARAEVVVYVQHFFSASGVRVGC